MAVARAVAVVGWDAAGCGDQKRTGLGERGTGGQGRRDKGRDGAAGPSGSPILNLVTRGTKPSPVCQAPLGG